ncbi:MAG: hypothetical protein KAG97_11005, partial [Victivallales bacterium]|nr:hypothetical protein [Victivallales bacterium]
MMEKYFVDRAGKRLIVLCVGVLVVLSMFLVGSGFTKVRGARVSRKSSRGLERDRWSVILDSMSVGLPKRSRVAWCRMAEE